MGVGDGVERSLGTVGVGDRCGLRFALLYSRRRDLSVGTRNRVGCEMVVRGGKLDIRLLRECEVLEAKVGMCQLRSLRIGVGGRKMGRVVTDNAAESCWGNL